MRHHALYRFVLSIGILIGTTLGSLHCQELDDQAFEDFLRMLEASLAEEGGDSYEALIKGLEEPLGSEQLAPPNVPQKTPAKLAAPSALLMEKTDEELFLEPFSAEIEGKGRAEQTIKLPELKKQALLTALDSCMSVLRDIDVLAAQLPGPARVSLSPYLPGITALIAELERIKSKAPYRLALYDKTFDVLRHALVRLTSQLRTVYGEIDVSLPYAPKSSAALSKLERALRTELDELLEETKKVVAFSQKSLEEKRKFRETREKKALSALARRNEELKRKSAQYRPYVSPRRPERKEAQRGSEWDGMGGLGGWGGLHDSFGLPWEKAFGSGGLAGVEKGGSAKSPTPGGQKPIGEPGAQDAKKKEEDAKKKLEPPKELNEFISITSKFERALTDAKRATIDEKTRSELIQTAKKMHLDGEAKRDEMLELYPAVKAHPSFVKTQARFIRASEAFKDLMAAIQAKEKELPTPLALFAKAVRTVEQALDEVKKTKTRDTRAKALATARTLLTGAAEKQRELQAGPQELAQHPIFLKMNQLLTMLSAQLDSLERGEGVRTPPVVSEIDMHAYRVLYHVLCETAGDPFTFDRSKLTSERSFKEWSKTWDTMLQALRSTSKIPLDAPISPDELKVLLITTITGAPSLDTHAESLTSRIWIMPVGDIAQEVATDLHTALADQALASALKNARAAASTLALIIPLNPGQWTSALFNFADGNVALSIWPQSDDPYFDTLTKLLEHIGKNPEELAQHAEKYALTLALYSTLTTLDTMLESLSADMPPRIMDFASKLAQADAFWTQGLGKAQKVIEQDAALGAQTKIIASTGEALAQTLSPLMPDKPLTPAIIGTIKPLLEQLFDAIDSLAEMVKKPAAQPEVEPPSMSRVQSALHNKKVLPTPPALRRRQPRILAQRAHKSSGCPDASHCQHRGHLRPRARATRSRTPGTAVASSTTEASTIST